MHVGQTMARSCKSFDTLQNGQLDTDNRITMTGTIKTIKEYENNFSYYESYVYKSVIELDTGHRVFGSVPTYKCSKRNCKIRLQEGERVIFDAKLENQKILMVLFITTKKDKSSTVT